MDCFHDCNQNLYFCYMANVVQIDLGVCRSKGLFTSSTLAPYHGPTIMPHPDIEPNIFLVP